MLLDDFRGEIREFLNRIIASQCGPTAQHPMCLLSECVLGSFIKHFTLCLENYIVFVYKMTFILLETLLGIEMISECHPSLHNSQKRVSGLAFSPPVPTHAMLAGYTAQQAIIFLNIHFCTSGFQHEMNFRASEKHGTSSPSWILNKATHS